MGGRSSLCIFDSLSEAIEWICVTSYLIEILMHLLDDFLSVESPGVPAMALEKLKWIFALLGVPLAPNKLFGPAQVLEFLGIILDTNLMEARLSKEQVLRLQQFISANLSRKKCAKRELLSFIGSLSFATKVVVPRRPFLSRLIKLSCTVSQLDHRVRKDLRMWSHFMQHWNGKSFFMEDHYTDAPDLCLYTDASGAHG